MSLELTSSTCLAACLALASAATAFADDLPLSVLPSLEAQHVFGGSASRLDLILTNRGAETASLDAWAFLVQAASATAAPLGDYAWKRLQVPPGQAVLESAVLPFPSVRAETRFLVQWMDRARHILGTTEVLVYPTNLLHDLQWLAADPPVGVFDPEDFLKPVLQAGGIEFTDLEQSGVANYRGRLAIIGPFTSRAQMPGDLDSRLEKLARRGAGVVWVLPALASRNELQPSFYVVPAGRGAVVVAQPQTVSGLARNPLAQQHLIHFCRLALAPKPLKLPQINDPT